jgi:uncharacterized protein YbaA (DUF1428 family)
MSAARIASRRFELRASFDDDWNSKIRSLPMAKYVDGFVIPIPKRNFASYKRMAMLGSKVWLDHGALEYFECVGDDLAVHCGPGYERGIKTKRGETVVFSFIVYKSRAHRDKVNAAVMKDPRIAGMMNGKKMPFDMERMLFGGFKAFVEA